MINCSRCGQANEASSRFCVACGSRLETGLVQGNSAQAPAVPVADEYPPPAAPQPGAYPVAYPPQAAVAPAPPPYVPPQPQHAPAAEAYGAPTVEQPAYPVQPAYPAPGPPPATAPLQEQVSKAEGEAPGPPAEARASQPQAIAGYPSNHQQPPAHRSPAGAERDDQAALTVGMEAASQAPMEPTKAPPSGVQDHGPLEFAETAPPMLGEDVLSRRILDRGMKQKRHGSSPELEGTVSPGAGPPQPLIVPADAPRVLAAFLVSYETNPLGQSWTVHQGSNLLGRAGAVAGADLELPHATVSSRHALLSASAHPGRLMVTDFGSTNGTFVNDTALVAHEPRELRDGDRVRFGLFTVIVKII